MSGCLDLNNTQAQNGEWTQNPQTPEAQDIVGYLQDFGLTHKEAEVYLALSKMGSATANDLVRTTKLSRLQAYRAIKGLLDSGLVEISLERPRKYRPLKIEQALSLLGQEAERKILDLEKKMPLLLEKWQAISELQVEKKNYTFRIIQGNKNVSKFRIMLYETAKKEISATMKPNDLMKYVTEGSDDVFEKMSSNNISVRGLSVVNKLNIDASKRFLEFSKLHHTAEANLLPFTIIDGQEILICLCSDGNGVSESAIWTNHPELVGIFKQTFDMIWSRSIDGNIVVRQIERIKPSV